MHKIYIVRHCEAQGQAQESRLTERGLKQAIDLSEFFSEMNIDHIISSPFKRALQSIEPLAEKLEMDIEISTQLSERILSDENMPDWFEKLKATFKDLDLKYRGGESSREAMNRIVSVVEAAFKSSKRNTVIVTHGNIMSLLLNYYNENFGFNEWNHLSNPDVFLLKVENNKVIHERLWVET